MPFVRTSVGNTEMTTQVLRTGQTYTVQDDGEMKAFLFTCCATTVWYDSTAASASSSVTLRVNNTNVDTCSSSVYATQRGTHQQYNSKVTDLIEVHAGDVISVTGTGYAGISIL